MEGSNNYLMLILGLAVLTVGAVVLRPEPEVTKDTRPSLLLYGDSITIGYTPYVKEALGKEYEIVTLSKNGRSSCEVIPYLEELPEKKYKVIHINVGLHDLRRDITTDKCDRDKGVQTVSPAQYQRNLHMIFSYLKREQPQARIIFALTTPVPDNSPGRFKEDVPVFNAVAKEVAKEYGVEINDLYSSMALVQPEYWKKPGDVHYTKAGSKLLADKVVEFIR